MLSRLLLLNFLSLSLLVVAQDATVTPEQVVEHYARSVHSAYGKALTEAKEMQLQIDNFVANPTRDTHHMAKLAWVQARRFYGLTEVFRFYNGPIDSPDGGPETLLNAWPLDEAYVDYVRVGPNYEISAQGIINDAAKYPTITEDLLIGANENGGEKNIATGFHAIEFLLWGQDFFDDDAGRRSHDDYILEKNKDATRRGEYLKICAALVVKHLTQLEAAWRPGVADNYAAKFTAMSTDEALTDILTGIGMMAGDELSSERMAVAYELQDQEDEHSCFSDMTHNDLSDNATGILGVLDGTVGGLEGPGVVALLATKDAAFAADLHEKARQMVQSVQEIPVPFDQAIKTDDGRQTIVIAMRNLEQLALQIATAAKKLGLEINIEPPAE